MKRIVMAFAILAWSAMAAASGLPYAVDSLEKAEALVKQAPARHLLVFYTHPS